MRDVTREMFENELLDLRSYVKENFEKSFTTSSDAGSVRINGICFPNGYGDGNNSIYVYDYQKMEFMSRKALVAHARDEIKVYTDDCAADEEFKTIKAKGLISIYRSGVKQFCILGDAIEVL